MGVFGLAMDHHTSVQIMGKFHDGIPKRHACLHQARILRFRLEVVRWRLWMISLIILGREFGLGEQGKERERCDCMCYCGIVGCIIGFMEDEGESPFYQRNKKFSRAFHK